MAAVLSPTVPVALHYGSSRAACNGIELVYQTFGRRTDRALLLVMGLGAQMIGWDEPFCRSLAERGHYVIRFDNRDTGLSTRFDGRAIPNRFTLVAGALRGQPLVVPYTLRDMADDAVGLLDALDVRQAHVVGASLGAAVAQEMAIHHPARVARLTSIMGMTGNMKLLRPRREALSVLFARTATSEAAYIAASRHAWRVLRAGRFPDDEARDVIRARLAWLRGYNPAGKQRQFAAFLASGNRTAALRRLDLPTQVIHGAIDPLVPLDAGRETAQVIPGARFAVIDGMGHALPIAMWPTLVDLIAEPDLRPSDFLSHPARVSMPDTLPASTRTEPATAHVNGVDLCYQSFGDTTRPTILLIMGLGTQMIAWDEVFCEQLAERGFRVIRFDNRDIGKSTWLDHLDVPSPLALIAKAAIGIKPKVPYTLADMAADSVGLLDALGIAKAHVVGASMGGMIGQVMAISHPDRLISFTSIMSTTGNSKLPSAKPEASALLVAKPVDNETDFLAFYKKLMKILRAGDFPEDEALDEARGLASWRRGYHPAGSARQLAAIIASGNRTEALKGVRVPTLVIHGRPDPLVPVEGGMATAEAIPGAKLLLLDRMGHAFPLSTWRTVIGAIADHAHAVANRL